MTSCMQLMEGGDARIAAVAAAGLQRYERLQVLVALFGQLMTDGHVTVLANLGIEMLRCVFCVADA